MSTKPLRTISARHPARCFTRALKNARYLRMMAPDLFAKETSAQGFGSGIPIDLLKRLHRIPPDSLELKEHPAVAAFLARNRLPLPGRNARDTLFSGTIFFVQVTFQTNSGNIVTSTSDMKTIVQYAQHAIVPISDYAALYGPNTVSVSPNVITYTASVPNASYQDSDVKGWVNDIAKKNQLPANSCVFIVSPSGLTAPEVGGNDGYHNIANIPYVVGGVFATNLTLGDAADVYAMVVSHEIAEMIVDPNVDGHNPEVCDPCDINCSNLTRVYFDVSNNFLGINQASPPGGFNFSYYICAVVDPNGASNCPASSGDCQYWPPLGNWLDGQHARWLGDFTGAGHAQVMMYSSSDGRWWLGNMVGSALNWSVVSQSAGFGNLLDGKHPIWIGDFTGAGHSQVMFYYSGDGHWWLGDMDGGTLNWSLVSQSAGFGNLLDGKHPIWLGDFTGAGHLQVMFYYSGDGHWWLGNMAGGALNWSLVSQSAGFGNLLDGKHPIWLGDFIGAGHLQVMFYYSGDGHWWLGNMAGGALNWSLVSQSAGFGNLLDGKHPIWLGDFTGAGHLQVMFYYSGDGHWWLGNIAGGALNWSLVSQSAGFGNLLDGKHPIWLGDFIGAGHLQVMFYYSGDGHWWLGNMAGGTLNWNLVSQSAGFGNLLDGKHPIWLGDFTGAGHLQVMFYYSGDGHWWLGNMAGGALNWSLVSQSAGFGNLLDGKHPIWLGDFIGAGHLQVMFYYSGDGHWWLGNMAGGTLNWSLVSSSGS